MAELCVLNVGASGYDVTGTYSATGKVFVSYSITNYDDKAVIQSNIAGTITTNQYARRGYLQSIYSGTPSTWTIGSTKYSITAGKTITASGSSTTASDVIGTTSNLTINKTHSTQTINVTAYYNYIIAEVVSAYSNKRSDNVYSAKTVTGTISIGAKKSYTVTFNANGGSGAPSAQTKWYGETLTLSSTKPTRTGYTFLGWSTSSTATSATYSAGGSYTANSAATLYAVWKLNTYSVTYNARGGSPTPSAQTKTYGVNLTLSSTVPTFAGYTFKGWATSTANANAGTVNYAKGATYTGNAALTLYAVWELTYTKPKITSISVARCTQDGTLDDNGDYAKVTFSWSVFRSSSARYYGGSTTPYSANGVSNCTVTIATTPAKSTTVSLSGASGTNSYAILGGVGSFEDDQSYKATVSITDSQTIYSDHTVSASVTLPPLFYPMDYNADASALGFFMPAPDSGDGIYSGKDIHFFVDENASTGWDALITEPLTVYGWTDALE